MKEEDIKKRLEFVRGYVQGTLEGLRYARENQKDALKILLKHKPELDPVLTAQQLKNAVTEVFLPPELVNLGLGFINAKIMEKTAKVVNEYFDVGRKVTAKKFIPISFSSPRPKRRSRERNWLCRFVLYSIRGPIRHNRLGRDERKLLDVLVR